MHYPTGKRFRLRSGVLSLSCLLLVSVFGLCSCAIKPLPSCIKVVNLEEVSAKRLRNDVAFLAGLKPPRNAANVDSLNRAAGYIVDEFGTSGCSVETQPVVVAGEKYKNIICSFGPDKGERVVVGAHYDVDEGGTPGADDNASGVAGILELARMLSNDRPALQHLFEINRRLDLVAYTLEEPPYFGSKDMGSYRHAESLFANKVPVKLMMSLEMIGYFSGEYAQYIAVVGKCEQRNMILRVSGLMAQGISIVPAPVPSWIQGVDFSDHRNFWEFDYPAVMVTDTANYRNPNYHQATDIVDTLDFKRMAGVVRGVYDAMICY